MSRDELKKELLETDDEFRRLFEEHRQLERRLDDLQHKAVLSQEDEMEQKQIKFRKLQLKDQMESILRSDQTAKVGV